VKALVLAHDHLSGIGHLGDPLADAGYDLTELTIVGADHFHEPDVSFEFPAATDFDLVVSLGAPWSVYDHERIGNWVSAERQLLRDADAANVAVLGVCFGGQLLAQALGGTVARLNTAEIGWHDIATDDAGLVGSGPWFEWHYDGWTVPPGARELARNATASQAYVLRRNLGIQFHPEVSTEILVGWLANGGEAEAKAAGLDPDELLAETRRRDDAAADRARELMRAFLTRVAPTP
jgi:GMP synthase-like glutamine amidotransferase